MSRLTSPRVVPAVERESEAELIARLKAGDTCAFDAIYEAFNARLFNFLARLTRSRQLAEDLLEETWLRLVAHVGRLQPDTRIGPWLFTVARNLHVSHCRSRMLEEAHGAGSVGLWPSAPIASPFDQAAANQLEARLEAAIARLPPLYREVVLLVVVDELEPAEAAEICGVSAATMRQRLKRARDLLAQWIDVDRSRAAVLREFKI